MNSATLDGKVALVTGASRPHGMGYATAEALARRGAAVVITDLPARREDYDVGAGLGDSETLQQAVRLCHCRWHSPTARDPERKDAYQLPDPSRDGRGLRVCPPPKKNSESWPSDRLVREVSSD